MTQRFPHRWIDLKNARSKLRFPIPRATPHRAKRAALPSERSAAILHPKFGRRLDAPPEDGQCITDFGMGCFWGAENRLMTVAGVQNTAVGYGGGTSDPVTYSEVCAGFTGHAEVVRVTHTDNAIVFARLLTCFWEHHDPTQGMRQGPDRGSQYRSVLFVSNPPRLEQALASLQLYQSAITRSGGGAITTEIAMIRSFCLAEPEHQQYPIHRPGGYCRHHLRSVRFPHNPEN